MAKNIGDTFFIEGSVCFSDGIECIIMEVGEDGRILKAKAAIPDDRLPQVGFIIEGEDYIIQEWNWSNN